MMQFFSKILLLILLIQVFTKAQAACSDGLDLERYAQFRQQCSAVMRQHGGSMSEVIESKLLSGLKTLSLKDQRDFSCKYWDLQRLLSVGTLRNAVNTRLLEVHTTLHESRLLHSESHRIVRIVRDYLNYFNPSNRRTKLSELPSERALLLAFYISEFGTSETESPLFIPHLRNLSGEKFAQVLLSSHDTTEEPSLKLAAHHLKNQMKNLVPLRPTMEPEDKKAYKEFAWSLVNSEGRFPAGKAALIPLLFEFPSLLTQFHAPRRGWLIELFSDPQWTSLQRHIPLNEVGEFLEDLQGVACSKQELACEFQAAFVIPYSEFLEAPELNLTHSKVLPPPQPLSQTAQVPRFGPLNAIHEFAKTEVFSQNSIHPNRDLLTAVFENMTTRLGNQPLRQFKEVRVILDSALEKTTPRNRQKFFFALRNADSQEQVCIAYTFLKTFHPESLSNWLDQFVEESLKAFSTGKPLKAVSLVKEQSCDAGVRDRAAIGLRHIDEELDFLFAQPTRLILMRGFCNMLNPRTYNLEPLGRYLVNTLKTTSTTPVLETIGKLKADFETKLQEYGLQDNEAMKLEGEIYADAIEEELSNPGSPLNQQLRKLESQQ